ncbi:MAG: T9SS type A sorting domain-containing protein [Ignavibacteriales bacterium]|nr:T9SS type A sorting domain-containing protein [Ignavibacteriales bacterium]
MDLSVPDDFVLNQNYPNPFNPSTIISWQSPVSGWQTLKVYDVLGKEVATLVNEFKPIGKYEIEFNASKLSSGVYFYQLKIENFTAIRKFLFVK